MVVCTSHPTTANVVAVAAARRVRSGTAASHKSVHSRRRSECVKPTEGVWKLGEILQTIEQSKIFRDFFDSERYKASQKRTKQARVKTRGRFYTASGPFAALPVRPYERAVSARKRSSAEGVGCVRGPAVRLRIIRLHCAYLLGLRCAPAQVRRELHDLADRFAGYLRDV
jgi:hypothetical protein